jgi:hypothetical protein
VWICIETLLRQEFKPDMIILWLSTEQFKFVEKLPENLNQLQKRGLTIRWCNDDLGSHKKYYYAFREYPNDTIITVDDDVIYNSKIISSLVELSSKSGDAICCNNAAKITVKDGNIETYLNWEHVETKLDPNAEIMPIGVGGILYPANSMYPDVFEVDILKKYCFFSDDIWLNVMARMNGTNAAKNADFSSYIPIMNSQRINLYTKNVANGFNDKQVSSMRKYYFEKLGVDPYKAILKK